MLGTQLKVLAFNPITVLAVLAFAAIVAAWVLVPSAEEQQETAVTLSPTSTPATTTSALLRVNGKVITIRSPKDPSKAFNIRVKEMADGSLRADVEPDNK